MVYEVITDCGFIFLYSPQAIHRYLYFNDVEMTALVHRCMLLLLPIIDGPPPVRVSAPSKVSWSLTREANRFYWLHKTDNLFIRKSFLVAHCFLTACHFKKGLSCLIYCYCAGSY